MDVTILQENLKKALSFVGKTVSTKTQLPILSNILLQTEEGRLRLSTTNLETSTSFWIGAVIEKEGEITVPARLLIELTSALSQEKIQLTTEGTILKIKGGESEATLSGIEAAEFPPFPQIKEKKEMVLEKSILEKSLPLVLVSASTDEGRPLLTGVKFSKKEGRGILAATDGYRLSVKEFGQPFDLEDGFVVSAKALSEVLRAMLEEKTETIDVFFSEAKNQIIFVLPQAQIATRLIEGEYPPYEKIIPSSFTTRVIFAKTELLKAVKLGAIYAKESSNIIRLVIETNKVTVLANTPQIGENKTTINVKTEGEGGEIAFNARFLLDVLNVFPEDEIAFEMSGPLAPGAFKPVNDASFLHIIMPVRVQG